MMSLVLTDAFFGGRFAHFDHVKNNRLIQALKRMNKDEFTTPLAASAVFGWQCIYKILSERCDETVLREVCDSVHPPLAKSISVNDFVMWHWGPNFALMVVLKHFFDVHYGTALRKSRSLAMASVELLVLSTIIASINANVAPAARMLAWSLMLPWGYIWSRQGQ